MQDFTMVIPRVSFASKCTLTLPSLQTARKP